MLRRASWPYVLALLFCLPTTACQGQPPPRLHTAGTPASLSDADFAGLVEQLSEPGGYFDTDNLISNERSYLHVSEAVRARQGGAYLGVGPDQNYSYIAQAQPHIAFLIDIRRDNLLQHLFFKALFAQAANRVEYLSLLFGRAVPDDASTWADRSAEALAAYIEAAPPHAAPAREAVRQALGRIELPLADEDHAAIARIHDRFIDSGLDLRFNSHGRPPRAYYPTYGQLMLERDRAGRPASYLADEAAFQFVKRLHAANRIIPVVGDLGGPHALAAIGEYLAEQGLPVTVFYTSNVEDYLMRSGRFGRYVENLRALPHRKDALIVRSYFNRWSGGHPQSVPGYASTQLAQSLDALLDAYAGGRLRSYYDLVNLEVAEGSSRR